MNLKRARWYAKNAIESSVDIKALNIYIDSWDLFPLNFLWMQFVYFTGGIVFLTLIVNGSTTQFVLHYLGMDKLSKAKVFFSLFTLVHLLSMGFCVWSFQISDHCEKFSSAIHSHSCWSSKSFPNLFNEHGPFRIVWFSLGMITSN